MKEFIEYIIKNLVDSPELVDVQCLEGERGLIVEVRVGPQDIGKVVGRKGCTVNSLRTIAMMIGARLGRKIRIEIID